MSVQTIRLNTSGAAQAGAVSRIRLVSQSVTGPAGADGGGALTTKGDLSAYSTVATRLPVGTNGQLLSADSAETTGLKWIAASGTGDLLAANNLSDVADAATALSNLGGATTAQGALADSATQPGDLATVATSGAYSDLSGTPTLGTAAATAATAYATAAQGATADTALQPAAIGATVQGYDADLADLAAIADAQGDIIVRGASGWERLAKSATSTHVLTAGASQPEWAAPSGGGSSDPLDGNAIIAQRIFI